MTNAADDWYHNCGENGLDCTYSKGKYAKYDASSCQDYHKQCRDYALKGECIKNEEWMKLKCPLSCAVCVASKLGDDDETCRDRHSQCPEWAKDDLECFVNPAYMYENCPQSCHFCVNATLLLEQGLEEEEIERRFLYSRTDFGVWQTIPKDSPNIQAITETIRRMGPYSQQELDNLGPGALCSNLHPSCAAWAVENGCGGDNLNFMLEECALACQSCHVTEQYYQCSEPRHNSSSSKTPVVSTNSLFPFWKALELKHSAKNLISSSNEWIASLNYTALWKKDASKKKIRSWLKEFKNPNLEWKEKGTGRFAICHDDCSSMDEIATTLLDIHPRYLEPLEFVHYKAAPLLERHIPQSDFEMHHQWKPSGPRLLTIFILLQPATKGGFLGFPDLDWLLVENAEILVWPNVANTKWNEELESMKHEQLPVVEGELYGIFTRVRQYPYEYTPTCN